jgi:hypothetical protein
VDTQAIIEEFQDLHAQLLAHYSVLVVLAYQKGLEDPTFEEFLRARVDTVLGRRLAKRDGVPHAIDAKVRNFVMEIAEAATFSQDLPKKRPTLRRRFLDWLERG